MWQSVIRFILRSFRSFDIFLNYVYIFICSKINSSIVPRLVIVWLFYSAGVNYAAADDTVSQK